MTRKKTSKDDRFRNWTFVVYPESTPDNWRNIIGDEYVKWIESPLHDKDTNENGEIKKPHIHILLMYDGKKSFDQIKDLTEKLNAPIPQKCANATGLVRYMLHLDNPDKYQYDIQEIVGHGGADVSEYFKLSVTNKKQVQKEIIDFIVDNGIIEFDEVVQYARHNNDDWFDVLMNYSTLSISTFIRSRRHKLEKQEK